MTAEAPAVWAVRAGVDDAFHAADIQRGLVGLGWRRVGDLSGANGEKAIRALVDQAYPDQQARTRKSTAVQLRAFRDLVAPGDVIVLHRTRSQDVAVGEVTGNYQYQPQASASTPAHTRTVRWLARDVPRRAVDDDLVSMPALAVITPILASDAAARLRETAREPRARREPDDVAHAFATTGDTPADNLQRNLAYALNLAEAGDALAKLAPASFNPDDMFRAAWTQAVTALDWWVTQEVRERILKLVDRADSAFPPRLRKVKVPVALLEDVASGALTIRESVLKHLIDGELGRKSYQGYEAISDGLGMVLPSTTSLWPNVVTVLNERAPSGTTHTTTSIRERLAEVAGRRHKIVHEYDSAPDQPSGRTPITYDETLKAIRWIEILTSAIRTVIEKH